jgi:PKD repeat protein
MAWSRRKLLSSVVVLTTLALFAWVVPGRAVAAPGGGKTLAAFGDHLERKATVYPVEFRQAVRAHRQRTETLMVRNIGEAPLIFAATACTSGTPIEDDLLGPGEPDGFGYVWHDSNEPGGPEFNWVEISQIGTKLPLSRDGSEVVDLPFVFPFYGEAKTSIRISSHGYMTFGTKGDAWSNKPIPTEDEPNDLIAVYWEDLNPPKAPPDGGVFYYHDAANNRFIVEWNKVPRSYEIGHYTFQAILYPDGRIAFQYLDMTFGAYYYSAKGTIGIESATGTDGVEVLYDTMGYMQSGLAIEIAPSVGWLSVGPSAGELAPGESMTLDVTFDLEQVASGLIEGAIVLHTNDARNPWMTVPVHIEVIPNSPPEIIACAVAPEVGRVATEFRFTAAAHDPDGHIVDKWWDFGDGSATVHDFVATHSYQREGQFVAAFTVVDNDGYATVTSVAVTVRKLPSASWDPRQFSFLVGVNQTIEGTLILSNEGNGDMVFGSHGTLPDMAYSIDPTAHPAGSELARHGSPGPTENSMRLVETDVGPTAPGDWLSWAPREGSVPPGSSVSITVTVDSRELEPGVHTSNVVLATNDAKNPLVIVPVTATVALPPVITEARAEPTFGEPPLDVTFDATIRPGDAEIVDIWWDFGDGTECVHKARAAHTYAELGKYEASVHAIDANGTEVEARIEITVEWLPVLDVDPEEFDEIVRAGEEKQTIMRLGNKGAGTMDFEISVGPGVPASSEWTGSIVPEPAKGGGSIIKVDPLSGHLAPGESRDIILTLGSPDAVCGTYSLCLYVSANDPHRPFAVIPVTLKINAPPAIEIKAPVGGDELHKECEIKWTATDPDDDNDDLLIDLAWTRDGSHWHELGRGLLNIGAFQWNTIAVGKAGETFRLRARATDPAGAQDEFVTGEFTIINLAPAADFGFTPPSPTVRDVVNFVDESTDDGWIVAWHWEFGDGCESFEPSPDHQYSEKGQFTVLLTVTDNGGLAATAEGTIEIVNLPPRVEIMRPRAGQALSGEATIEWKATDADDNQDALKITLEYRPEEGQAWQAIVSGGPNSGKHVWDTAELERGGKYRIRVTAADPEGASGAAISEEFTVIALTRMITAAPNPASERVTFYYDIDTDGELLVYDVAGRPVHMAKLWAAAKSYEWDLTRGGRPVANGFYLYVVITDSGERSEVGRLVIGRR